MNRKTLKKNPILIIFIGIMTLIASISAVFAFGEVFNFNIQENRPYLSGKNIFTIAESGSESGIGDDDVYYHDINITSGVANLININKFEKTAEQASQFIGYQENINSFDILVYTTTNANNITINCNGNVTPIVATSTYNLNNNSKAYLYSNVDFSRIGEATSHQLSITGSVSEQIKVVVLEYSTNNKFISNFFDLQMISNENHFNYADENVKPTGKQTYFKNVYFIDNFSITQDFYINYPCNFNLLYANITLQENLTIKHHGVGYYEVESISGTIDNTNAVFAINCPYAYYSTYTTSIVGEVVTTVGSDAIWKSVLTNQSSNYIQNSDNVDFTLPSNATLLTALINDAKNFALYNVENYIINDVILPNSYHNYGIDFIYSITKANAEDPETLNAFGNITRVDDTKSITVTASFVFNGVEYAISKHAYVIGTSDTALVEGLANILKEKMSNVYESQSMLLGENTIVVPLMNKSISIKQIITNFMATSGTDKTIQLSTEDASYLSFDVINGITHTEYNKILVRNNSGNVEFSFDNGVNYNILSDENIRVPSVVGTDVYLSKDIWVFESGMQNLKISIGSLENENLVLNDLSVMLESVSEEEKIRYLNRYINTVYFASVHDEYELLTINENNLVYGEINIENLNIVMPKQNGLQSIDYVVYLIDVETYTALIANTITLTTVLSDVNTLNYNNYFTFENGILTPNSVEYLQLNNDQVLILTTSFDYLADTNDYQTFRQIVIPADGIGGSEYVEFISGDTFKPYFDSLEEGKLINSVAGIGGNAHVFKTTNSAVGLDFTIDNDDIASFCSVITNDGESQINIVVNNIPNYNVIVHITASFYIINMSDLTDKSNLISIQKYEFTIPGIYKKGVGEDFTNTVLYDRIVDAKDGNQNKLYESFDGYLLVDGAKAEVESLDCSLDALQAIDGGVTASTSIDLKGIELLENTRGFIFDNCLIASLEPFSAFETHNVNSLSLVNSGIDNAKLQSSVAPYTRYLYSLNNLTSLNISNIGDVNKNAISSLTNEGGESLIYRTITNLNWSNQVSSCLTDISSITILPNLQNIDVSNNAIKSFEPLTQLNSLVNAYIYGNVAVEFTNKSNGDTLIYYGSLGEINKPVKYLLRDKGVNVYDRISDGEPVPILMVYNENENQIALMLNSIMYFYVQKGGINLPNKLYEINFNNSGVNGQERMVTANYIIFNDAVVGGAIAGHNSDKITVANVTNDSIIKLIFGITVNSVTLYREITILYKVA